LVFEVNQSKRSKTMTTDNRRVDAELVQEVLLDDPGFLREIVEWVVQQILEPEISEHIGAAPYERTNERKGHRNGHKGRTLRTRVGALNHGRVASVAVVLAVGVNAETGEREVSGFEVGPSEDGAFWSAFLRSLVARGLCGVRLVTSDAHRGLKSAVAAVLVGSSWQRCRVHFMRNALTLVPKAAQQMVGAIIRTVFAQPDSGSTHEQWLRVSEGFRHWFPRLSELMDEADEDVLCYAALPTEHWQKIWSNNHLKRLNKEIKRRTNVVGIFPNEGSVIRLVGSVLSEQHEEWQVSKRYFSAGSLAKVDRREVTEQPQLMAG
jgi:putative transposase